MSPTPLNAACRRYRERLSLQQPGGPLEGSHRENCPECARFADMIENTADQPRPMSSRLRSRLRDIPRLEVTCREVERLYREAKRRADAATGHPPDPATGHPPDPASARHLDSCLRCREIYGALQCAFEPEHQAIPKRLARRLGEFARRPDRLVPVWISDTRYAAAACYLLAALSLSIADSASAVLRETTETVASRVNVWTAAGEDRRTRVWEAATAPLERSLAASWNRFDSYREAGSRWAGDAFRMIEDTTRELIPDQRRSVEGDPDE